MVTLLLARALAQDECGNPPDCPQGATCDCTGVCIELEPRFELLEGSDTEMRGYGNSRGINMNDFNGDGRLDLFLGQAVSRIDGGPTWPGDDILYVATEGDLEFEEVAGEMGVDDGCENRSPLFGDLDNDGLPDLFVTTNGVPVVYRNDGWERYVDHTAYAGEAWAVGWGHQGFLFDYDLDGFLDVFWTNGPEDGSGKNILLRNQGDGTFQDTSDEAGVAGFPSGKGTCVLDADVDGLPDIFVATGREFGHSLFMNQGDGTFVDEASERGVYDPWQRFGVGVNCADYDNDGDPDIMLITHDRAFGGNQVFRNEGGGYFRDVAAEIGLAEQIDGHGSAWLDLDMDGWLDVVMAGIKVPPYAFLNNRDGTFSRVCDGWGIQQDDGLTWAVAGADYTGDGYPEVYIANGLGRRPRDDEFFLNAGGPNHHFTVEVVGVTHNPSQLGARVEITAGGFTQTRWVGGWSSFDSQGPLPVTVGVGAATVIDEVRVTFTDGTVVTDGGFDVDQSVTITEPWDRLDADFDGVPDEWDACPGTARNQRTDGEGCGYGQRGGVGVALVSPADRVILADPPTFTWATEGVSSVLQVSIDGTFGPYDRFDYGPLDGDAYTLSDAEWAALTDAMLQSRPLAWRVVSMGEDGEEGISDPRIFDLAVPTQVVHVPEGVNYFEPAHIVVQAGDSVTWWNDSVAAGNIQNEPHDVQVIGQFGEPFTYMNTLNGAGYFTYTFNEPGVWYFICHRHSGVGVATDHVPETLSFHRPEGPFRCMAGSITVK